MTAPVPAPVPASDASGRAYLRQVTAVAGALLGVLALFNIWADPHGMFRKFHLPHLNKEPEPWSRVSAAERLADHCEVALLGSSRIMHGFGPEMPRWGRYEVCNGALGGTSIRELREVFDWVLRQRSIRYAILFTDFQLFLDARGVNGDFNQSRFNDDRTPLAYYTWGLTSMDASRAGLVQLGLAEGYHFPGSQIRANHIELYRFLKNPHLYTGWTGDDETINVLRSILDDAARRKIHMLLIIPSVHALLLQTEYDTERWDRALAWRKRLVEMLAERRGPRVQLWDFCTFHEYATTPMPTERDALTNEWWVDVSHQSMKLGYETMARVVDAAGTNERTWPDQFGVLLTPDNIDDHLARLDADRAAYAAANPDQLAWLAATTGEIMQWPTPAGAEEDVGGFDLELPTDAP